MPTSEERRAQWDAIEKKVADYWSVEKSKGSTASVRKLHERYSRKNVKEISLSKFNQIVRGLDKNAPPESFPRSEWKPWVDQQLTSEDSAFLLRLNAISLAEEGRNLLIQAAEWARRLRVALEGLHPYGQYKVVETYLLRQMHAYYLGHDEAYTADLDGLLAYKPWLPENQLAYGLAVASGSVPFPFIDPSASHSDSFLSYLPNDLRPSPELSPLFMWLNSDEARENFLKFHDRLRRIGAVVEWMLCPGDYQMIQGENDAVQFRAGLTRMAFEEDDLNKREMLDRLLKLWAGKTLEEITKEGGIHEG